MSAIPQSIKKYMSKTLPEFHPRQRIQRISGSGTLVAIRFLFLLFMYLFIAAVLGLTLLHLGFLCCSEWGTALVVLSLVAVHWRLRLGLQCVTHGLHCPTTVESSEEGGAGHVPSTLERTLDHWTTRKVPYVVFICV